MSFVSKVTNWFKDKVESQAPRQSFAHFRPGGDDKPILAGKHYFRIWLKDMRLGATTRWFTDFYPATHSLMNISAGDERLEFANLVGPVELGEGVNQANIGNSVIINKPITPLVPFGGGTVSLDAGLVSVPTEAGIKAALDIVSTFAKALNVPQVSVALQHAEAVASSIGQLLQLNGPAIQLNYSASYSGSEGGGKLEDVHFVVAGLPDGTLKAERLWVVDEKLAVGASADTAEPLNDCNYMLFHLERVAERDDWEKFSYIAEPIQEAIKAKLEGDEDKAKLLRVQAISKIMASQDLTQVDKYRIIKIVRQRIDNMGVDGPEMAAVDLDLDSQEFAVELAKSAQNVEEAFAEMPKGWEEASPF